jgi:hypothetical protein
LQQITTARPFLSRLAGIGSLFSNTQSRVYLATNSLDVEQLDSDYLRFPPDAPDVTVAHQHNAIHCMHRHRMAPQKRSPCYAPGVYLTCECCTSIQKPIFALLQFHSEAKNKDLLAALPRSTGWIFAHVSEGGDFHVRFDCLHMHGRCYKSAKREITPYSNHVQSLGHTQRHFFETMGAPAHVERISNGCCLICRGWFKGYQSGFESKGARACYGSSGHACSAD